MSQIKTKSELNALAADLLFKNAIYAPSVHCAYYSVFQLMKYIVKVSIGIDYSDQQNEINKIKTEKSTRNIGTHEYIILKICNELNRIDLNTYKNLNRKIKDLKKFRHESDYDNKQIDQAYSNQAIFYSKEINYELRKTFSIL